MQVQYRVCARDDQSRVTHANTRTPQTSTRYKSTPIGSIDAATELHGPDVSFVYIEVATIYNIDHKHYREGTRRLPRRMKPRYHVRRAPIGTVHGHPVHHPTTNHPIFVPPTT
jgi:hypothetical protein